MTYVYASRMGKTEKLIEKLAIDAMKIENGTETVSYTHLDVYKRQALQYSYLKDEKKKKEHLQAASKDLKGTPYEMKINQLMKK